MCLSTSSLKEFVIRYPICDDFCWVLMANDYVVIFWHNLDIKPEQQQNYSKQKHKKKKPTTNISSWSNRHCSWSDYHTRPCPTRCHFTTLCTCRCNHLVFFTTANNSQNNKPNIRFYKTTFNFVSILVSFELTKSKEMNRQSTDPIHYRERIEKQNTKYNNHCCLFVEKWQCWFDETIFYAPLSVSVQICRWFFHRKTSDCVFLQILPFFNISSIYFVLFTWWISFFLQLYRNMMNHLARIVKYYRNAWKEFCRNPHVYECPGDIVCEKTAMPMPHRITHIHYVLHFRHGHTWLLYSTTAKHRNGVTPRSYRTFPYKHIQKRLSN